jgi:magnesium transporter
MNSETPHEVWTSLSDTEKKAAFRLLPRSEAEELFLNLNSHDQFELLVEMATLERRSWIRLLAPDDAADLVQEFPVEERPALLSLLDEVARKEVIALLAYAEDDAGGLMSSRFIRLRPDMSVDEAIRYIRVQARTPVEMIYYAYVVDASHKLVGVVSFRELLLSPPNKLVREIMETELITIPEDMDQEEVSRRISGTDLMALPVVNAEGSIKGIVTVDDVVDVVKEEATEDIQKMGGQQALDKPYLKMGFWAMVRKRAGWLVVLFIGEMFTATAMAYYKVEIESAVVLALFIPLIISSGGNSGSQTSSLIIRAIALGEVTMRDWLRVLIRELGVGLCLGAILGGVGYMRIIVDVAVCFTSGGVRPRQRLGAIGGDACRRHRFDYLFHRGEYCVGRRAALAAFLLGLDRAFNDDFGWLPPLFDGHQIANSFFEWRNI